MYTPYENILLDIEAQRDFFCRGGSCFSRESLPAARNVWRLFRWARSRHVPVLSAVLRLRPGSPGPLADVPHCIEGTDGERRIPRTLLSPHLNFGMRNVTDMPADVFEQYRQVIIEMRCTDIFLHARAERLLTELKARTFVLCGAGSAHGLVEAVLGLRHRGFGIVLATDAILDLDDPLAEMAWLRMLTKGGVPMTTDEVVGEPWKARGRRQYAGRFAEWRKGVLTS